MDYTVRFRERRTFNYTSHMTFTGLIGRICMFPLRAIIAACVALRIHPNILTFVGVLINGVGGRTSWRTAEFVRPASS